MIGIGDRVPELEVRTDEGTPLSLTDLRGRALALFALGESFTPTAERMLGVLAEETGRFLALGCSPVAVLGEPVERLAEFREHRDPPFLVLADPSLELHAILTGDQVEPGGAWIVDDEGAVRGVVPALPPTEVVSLALGIAARELTRGDRPKRLEPEPG